MDHTGRMDIFETTENLVKKVLDELFLKRARGKESMKVGTEKLGDKVAS